jgi:hypothetical protein
MHWCGTHGDAQRPSHRVSPEWQSLRSAGWLSCAFGVSTGLKAMDPHHSRRSVALTLISHHALRTL